MNQRPPMVEWYVAPIKTNWRKMASCPKCNTMHRFGRTLKPGEKVDITCKQCGRQIRYTVK